MTMPDQPPAASGVGLVDMGAEKRNQTKRPLVLLIDIKARGLAIAPEVAVGDGALG